MTLDVEDLFSKFTVTDVKEIEKKIKIDVEKKKEDLRQMVGRRYRDLIEAADSIGEMKDSSQNILTSVRRIHSNVEKLTNIQQQLLVATQRSKINKYSQYESGDNTAALAKCIGDFPELMFQALDDLRPLDAAWCLVIAERLYAAVQLNASRREGISKDTSAFIERRMTLIREMKPKILTVSLDQISSYDLAADVIMDAVCAIAFLECPNLNVIIEKILNCRSSTLQKIFANPESSSREQICSSLSLIQKTLLHMCQIFLSADDASKDSQMIERIKFLITSQWQPDVMRRYRNFHGRTVSLSMPDGFDYTSVFSLNGYVDVNAEQLQKSVTSWLNGACALVNEKFSESMSSFDTIKSLTVLKDSIVAVLLGSVEIYDWDTTCQRLLNKKFALWPTICANHLEERLEAILKADVDRAFEQLVSATNSYRSISPSACPETSNSISSALFEDWWRESSPPNLKSRANASLQLKARGLTSEIYKHCDDLNSRFADMEAALSGCLVVHAKRSDADRFVLNSTKLKTKLAEFCVDSCTRFIESLTEASKLNNSSSGFEDQSSVPYNVVVGAKILQCLSDLSGNFKKIVAFYPDAVERLRSSQEPDRWNLLRNSFHKSATGLYTIWAKSLLKLGCERIRSELQKAANTEDFWLEHIREWDAIAIEEEAEDGEKVTSKIYVPVICSEFVYDFLRSISRAIVDIGAQSIHSDVLVKLSSSAQSTIANIFEEILMQQEQQQHPSGFKLGQKQAVQLLFDFRVLLQILRRGEHTEDDGTSVAECSQRVMEKLESLVDPFDMDVMRPHLKSSMAKVLQKSQSLYRPLFTPEALRAAGVGGKAASTASAESSQVLALTCLEARFHLLPLPSQETSQQQQMPNSSEYVSSATALKTGRQKPIIAGQTQSTKGLERFQTSGAALASSFYDKLSSSWFGGS